jgi:cytochrome c oxidase subunit 4
MTEPNPSQDHGAGGEHHHPYIKVWFALAVFTLIEYLYARAFKDTFTVLLLGLMFWAVIKASLVGWYFMHLKYEGNWVYCMLVPAGFLAAVFVLALAPDVSMQPESEEGPVDEEVAVVAPLVPGQLRL